MRHFWLFGAGTNLTGSLCQESGELKSRERSETNDRRLTAVWSKASVSRVPVVIPDVARRFLPGRNEQVLFLQEISVGSQGVYARQCCGLRGPTRVATIPSLFRKSCERPCAWTRPRITDRSCCVPAISSPTATQSSAPVRSLPRRPWSLWGTATRTFAHHRSTHRRGTRKARHSRGKGRSRRRGGTPT